ncbi:cytochrome c biogenesis protein CcdA [Rummeliibacillus sp. G93]|uniref:cytochrome c biogenesis CcdA family protein n=1 Tax=Rummeliibacillus TaxID=648802 RepID=UPI00116C9C7D|nr:MULTISPECIES: cytochrome c biogenesis protein CcdA [Rummeliibacillus]MBB5169367.1 cytochrome c-type biogenesis protein [Rummeliibacillus stabekisii]UQW98882.1 cytochrome c biogenesis protein CcdA [Rummeliibacillus sp. G93]GEL03628.1 cytochrome C biogenesis protein CcdA [Rummeliibacillus stabekisii]
MNTDVNVFLAFGAGFLSFISPCTLPLYPAFLSYITGVSFDQLKSQKGMMQRRAILHTVFFLIGFSMIFIALGFGASFVKGIFVRYDELIRQVGGILIVVFGLVITGIFTPKFLMKDRKFELKSRPSGYIGSILIGLVFAAGWTPCTGPILGSIMLLGSTHPDSAIWYMLAYVLGFSIPFFVLSFFISRMNWIRRNSQKIVKVGGYIMIVVGIVLFFDGMTYFNRLISPLFGGFQGF